MRKTYAAIGTLIYLLQAPPHPRINLVFDDLFSLFVALALLIGAIAWLTYMFVTQRKLVRKTDSMVTKAELTEAFMEFRKELKSGK